MLSIGCAWCEVNCHIGVLPFRWKLIVTCYIAINSLCFHSQCAVVFCRLERKNCSDQGRFISASWSFLSNWDLWWGRAKGAGPRSRRATRSSGLGVLAGVWVCAWTHPLSFAINCAVRFQKPAPDQPGLGAGERGPGEWIEQESQVWDAAQLLLFWKCFTVQV